MIYSIIPIGNGRYAICNENYDIIDDAQGYGYTDIIKARKAKWYKYEGGKEKLGGNIKKFNKWLSSSNHKEIYDKIIKTLEINSKIIEDKLISKEEVINMIVEENNFYIPKFILREYLNIF